MKRIRFFSVLAGLCLILYLGAGMACAQSLQEKADVDKDKIVTPEEMTNALAERYKKEDAGKDGKLTVDEYLQARQKNFDDADKNKDKLIGIEEWVIYWCGTANDAAKIKKPVKMDKTASRSQRMDTSKDGKIQPNECVAFWGGRFIDLDENKDGKLTRDEYINRMKDMAKTMDLDGDGVITIEEYYISWIGKDKTPGKGKKSATKK